MWRQLTQHARKAIFLAQHEAGRLGYSHVGPEHLLLALIREDDCVAASLLERLGIDLGTLKSEVMKDVSKGSEHLGEEMQLTVDAKQVIDYAFAEGRRLNDEWIGTEHLLLGLARETGGVAASVLNRLGADPNTILHQLRNLQAGRLPFGRLDANGGASYQPTT
jgi:ATP-dependent Clp protease ATP-binding subunit ClpC